MSLPSLTPEQQLSLDFAVERALLEFQLDAGFGRTLRAMALRPSDDWMICCDGGCDPCVLTLGRAVEEIRARLSWIDFGASSDDHSTR